MKKTADILFEYLKDILYHPNEAHLDLSRLSPEFRKLGQGMQFLAECVKEERAFTRALAKGDLSQIPPSVENVLAAPAKELQSSLRHLEWQTEQVAKGDYTQQVDFMGEFSIAFNNMTKQLSERTAGLIAERKLVEEKNRDLKQNLDFMLALINYTHNMIFVFSAGSQKQIFANEPAQWFMRTKSDAATLLQNQLQEKQISIHSTKSSFANWELSLYQDDRDDMVYYDVESFFIHWHEEPAVVHIIIDDTERKKREKLIYSLAYIDPLTKLPNRRYAMDLMERWVKENTPFLLSFIDIDYLKYCNDTYGHECGDQYLVDVVSLLKTMHCDLCRVGGDEFFLLTQGSNIERQNKQLSLLRELLLSQINTPYPKSFSFATSIVPASPPLSLHEYINNTDKKMYEYKLQNKRPLVDVVFKDDRI